jgi:hypothetical protein
VHVQASNMRRFRALAQQLAGGSPPLPALRATPSAAAECGELGSCSVEWARGDPVFR